MSQGIKSISTNPLLKKFDGLNATGKHKRPVNRLEKGTGRKHNSGIYKPTKMSGATKQKVQK